MDNLWLNLFFVCHCILRYFIISLHISLYPSISHDNRFWKSLILRPPRNPRFLSRLLRWVSGDHSQRHSVRLGVRHWKAFGGLGGMSMAAAEWICFFWCCLRPSMGEKSTDFWWNLLYFTIFCSELSPMWVDLVIRCGNLRLELHQRKWWHRKFSHQLDIANEDSGKTLIFSYFVHVFSPKCVPQFQENRD